MIQKLFYVGLGLVSSSVALAATEDEISWDAIEAQIQQSGSVHLLAKLYGSWVLNLFGNSAGVTEVVTPVTVFAALIGVAGWTLFMLLAGYVGIVGLLKTAQQGQFLGKDWDSTWILARMLGALILSAPLASAGGSSNLAAGQTLVIRAAVVSSAAADIIWGKTLAAIGRERIKSDKTMQVDVNFTPEEARSVIAKGYGHGMCYAASIKYETGLQDGSDPAAAQKLQDGIIDRCGMEPLMWRRAIQTGSVNYFESDQVVKAREGDLVVGGVDLWYSPEKMHRADLISSSARSVAEQYYYRGFRIGSDEVNQTIPSETSAIKILEIASEFHKQMKSAIETQVQAGYANSATMYGQEAQKYGWVSAGNFYRVLATQQTTINAALNEATNVGGSHINPEALTSGLPTDDLIYYNTKHAVTWADRTREIYEGSLLTRAANSLSENSTIGQAVTAGGQVRSAAADGLDAIGLNLFRAGETTDPLVASSNIGHGLVALSVGGKIATMLPAVKKTTEASGMGGAINTVLTILFIVGVFLGDILPSLPWVYFLFGTIAWLVHVTEMFVSAPLWIAAHAAPEGSAHTSNLAAKGYNNMLYVMLYPVLAIGGFVAAMSINWIGMYMLNQLIGEQFSNQLGGGLGLLTHGLGTLVGFAFLYLACAWILVNTSFNLIQSFPRTILNWLSTADAGHNAYDGGGGQVLGVGGLILTKAGGKGVAEKVMNIGGGQKRLSQNAPLNSPTPTGP